MQKSWITIGCTFIAGIVAIVASTGCKAGASCVDGAYKDADTGVCIKLGGNLAADKAQKSGDSSSLRVKDTKTLDSFTIWIEKPEDLDKRAKIVENMASSDLVLVEKGDTVNKGKFFHFHHPQGGNDFAVALVPGKEHFYRCEIQNTPPAQTTTFLDACKTVSGP